MTTTAQWIGGMYTGETSDGKIWMTTRRYVNGNCVHVVRFLANQGPITAEHKAAARLAVRS